MRYTLYWQLEGRNSYLNSDSDLSWDEAYEGQQNLIEDFRDYPDAEVWILEHE